MKSRAIPYSDEELTWLEWRQAMSRRALHALFVERFGRPDVTLDQIKALCTRMGWMTGRTGCIEKGAIPHNKGKPMSPETREKVARTWFRSGNLPHTHRGVGHESVRGDGYVWLIVAERNPYTGAATRAVQKHRWRWEQANGPVPEGHVLKCLDGDRTNTDPSNWEAVPRALLTRLNGGPRKRHLAYDDAPADLRPTILATARLAHAARERRRG